MTTKLRQTGNAPYILDAQAKLLFDEDNGTAAGIGSKHWHWLRLFHADVFVAAIEFRERDTDHCMVLRADTLDALFVALRKYDTSKYVIGLPARSGNELTRDGGRNKTLLDDIKQRWDELLTRAAKELSITEATPETPSSTPEDISVSLPPALLSKLDAARKEQPRADFIRKLIEDALSS